MVLRPYYFYSHILCIKFAGKSVSVLMMLLACLCNAGCRWTQADNTREELRCNSEGLTVSEANIRYVKDSLERLFQWEAYWSYNDFDSRAGYMKNVGSSFSISIYSLRKGLIVFVPGLDHSAVKFRKDSEGKLSNPIFIRSGATLEQDKLLALAKVIGNWREFLLLAGAEESKEADKIPLIVSDVEITNYLKKNHDTLSYCESQGEINLLPIEPISYGPMDDRKQALLKAIIRECERLTDIMISKNQKVIITVPNFNYNDSSIWVLLEEPTGEAYTVSMSLDITNSETPVTYMTTVEIRSSPKYGKPIDADKKIKKNPIKVLEYRTQ